MASPAAARLAGRFWPGPLTLVVPLRPGVTLPYAVTGGSHAVGLRVPDQSFARLLARALGPLPLTSANRSGEPDARDVAEVQASVGAAVEVIIDGGRSPGGVPSTVVALEPDGSWRLLRAGPISDVDLARALSLTPEAGRPGPPRRGEPDAVRAAAEQARRRPEQDDLATQAAEATGLGLGPPGHVKSIPSCGPPWRPSADGSPASSS